MRVVPAVQALRSLRARRFRVLRKPRSGRARTRLRAAVALAAAWALACPRAGAAGPPVDSTVVFNEIQYHPAGNEAELEWIELYNQMSVDMDISGWSLADGVFFVFPEGTIIQGRKHLVVAADPAALQAATGFGGALGPFAGRLENSGERLELRNNSYRLMDSIRYRDEGDWPVGPDGSGHTLAKIRPDFASGPAAHWTWSREIGGTPGKENFPAGAPSEAPAVALNEIAPASGGASWLEVANWGDAALDLGGFAIEKLGSSPGSFAFASGTLAAGGRRAVPASELGFDFALGDRLFLWAPGRTALLDAVEVKTGPRARHPDGTGRWLVPSAPTPGAANAVSLVETVVVNEILYRPRSIPETPPVTEDQVLVPIDATWKYDGSGADRGTAWRFPTFDDGSWPSGRGLLYNETGALPAPKNTPLSIGPTTFYFRTRFEFSGDPAGVLLRIRHVVDDGAVFWLNGVEVLRWNMPSGEIAASTLASSGVGDAVYQGPFDGPPGILRSGTNVLAVEVHQASTTSSDVVFGAEVLASVVVSPGRPFGEPPGSFVEIHNRGAAAVDLSGWRLDGGIRFEFEPGTVLPAGGCLAVAEDRDYLRALHPGAPIAGNFTGVLSNATDRVVLRAADGNPADEVTYFDGGRWPVWADGGGSSLELRDPRADNSVAEAWAASAEGGEWKTYSYDQTATANIGPTQWNEFVLGLLDEGEILLDDVSVVESPDTAPVQLIQNGSFETGSTGWRLIGNHRHSEVIADPESPSNRVLRLVATGPTEHMHNHAETTLAGGRTVANGRVYRVSFRAKWIAGSNALHTRLYFNRVPRTTLLERPVAGATPGAPNSRLEGNIGPTFRGFSHAPAVPKAQEPVTVSVEASDPDGVASAALWWSVNGGAWTSVAMAEGPSGRYSASIPGQASGAIVQFYAEARDSAGKTAAFPAAGRASRALYKVEANASTALKHTVRLVLTAADANFLHTDTNVMSNDKIPATMIYDEREVFYDVGVHLKGSERGRNQPARVGFHVDFQPDRLFRGAHRSIALDRSGGWAVGTLDGQDEVLVKHLIQSAGGIPGEYVDIVHLIAPRSAQTGASLLQMARYEKVFLDSQWEGGGEGTLFDFELIYYPRTTDTGTPEGLKRPEPDSVLGVDIANHGDEKEVYRWNFVIQNNRDRDDYSDLVRFCKSWSLSGAALDAAIQETTDADEWMRMYAMMSLCGIGDAYTFGNNHNVKLWVRPEDRRVLGFPWDWDFAFFLSATGPLWGDQNLAKVVQRPACLHLFYGHLLDILDTVYNTAYMSRWTSHYGTLAGENYATFLSYIGTRASSVRSRLPARVDFQITTNGGEPFSVAASSADIEGNAWVDVATILVEGREERTPISWTTATRWRAAVRLDPGRNSLVFLGFHRDGRLLAFDEIEVTSTVSPPDPAVVSIDPVEGPPGTLVAIAGANFLPTMEVLFGGTPASSVEVLGATSLRARVPSMEPGVVALVVRNAAGGSSAPVEFTVLDAARRFVRGDANMDGAVTISDAVRILFHLFGGLPAPCEDAADANDDEGLNLADALYVLRYLFQGGPAPAAPFPEPGEDSGGALGCRVGL